MATKDPAVSTWFGIEFQGQIAGAFRECSGIGSEAKPVNARSRISAPPCRSIARMASSVACSDHSLASRRARLASRWGLEKKRSGLKQIRSLRGEIFALLTLAVPFFYTRMVSALADRWLGDGPSVWSRVPAAIPWIARAAFVALIGLLAVEDAAASD